MKTTLSVRNKTIDEEDNLQNIKIFSEEVYMYLSSLDDSSLFVTSGTYQLATP